MVSRMGRPVLHFEVIGKDGEKLRGFYSDLFDWKIDADNPMGYGIVDRESNLSDDGAGIGGGVAGGPGGYEGHVTFYVEGEDVEQALARAEGPGRRSACRSSSATRRSCGWASSRARAVTRRGSPPSASWRSSPTAPAGASAPRSAAASSPTPSASRRSRTPGSSGSRRTPSSTGSRGWPPAR